ncbi:MAG: T9SS type A sorting domain-containing protein [Saprospiraceae bacterium]
MKYCFLATLIFLLSCQITPESNHNRLDQKYEPGEILFLQKAYPAAEFDLAAHTKALREVSEDMLSTTTQKENRFDAAWVNQGPNNIGGRVNTIAINPMDNNHMLIGYSVGGVFETTDGGQSWSPIFDDQPFTSIGDIAFDPTDPNTIWVGTGDPNISGYPFIGDGVYKSTDGGATWQNMGLTETRIVSSIQIHPFNSNIVYAATMGVPFTRNNDRGVYRSLDGGSTWEQILFIDQDAGAIDLILNPDNPNVLYAAGWNRIRNNRESLITGAAAKVFRSLDGGDSWETLEGGLPQQDNGRVGIAMAPTNSNRLYAMYVGDDSNLHSIYTSADGGDNWTEIPTNNASGLNGNELGGFGWYFGQIRVHPFDENRIYLLGVELWEYQNENWSQATPSWFFYEVHADKHDLAFTRNGHMILGTDGGLYRSSDSGNNWQDIENISTTQFYRVAYNPHRPDLYYGGAQDNGTTGGNQLSNLNWERIYGSDGFQPVFHPEKPEIFYVETQNGGINVTMDNGGSYMNATSGISGSDRRNWDMPYVINPLNSDELFAGTYRIYRSTEGAVPDWEAVSEDLTDGIADRYHTISTLHASSIADGLVVVGTSDANLWRTDDHGDNWERLDDETLPNRFISDVKTSPTDANRIFVSYSGYKDGDNRPQLYQSDDRGATWFSSAGDLPNIAINDIYVLPNQNDSVLFVGTDGGVFASLNAGENWERLGMNMPIIPIYDMTWNEVQNQLIAGTYARGIYTYPLDTLLQMDVMTATVDFGQPVTANPLKIYPNPAQDYVNIEFLHTEKGKQSEVVIVNTLGQVVYQDKVDVEDSAIQRGVLQLNISKWQSGVYQVKIKAGYKIFGGQLLVK